MKKIRILFTLVLFSTLGFSVDVLLDQNSSDESKLSESSKVYFGENIFQGNFKENKQFRYNPNYLINVGDVISVKMWGAYEFISDLTVDKQGNIFLPKVGAISLLGLATGKLKDKIEKSIKAVFNDNVYIYADIQQYQPISVFVSGSVNKVGLYDGLSTDSILQFIDKADGLIRGQGSFRNISILRNKEVVKNIDLYQFLIDGEVDSFQFQNGDVILVNSVQKFIEVEGDVNRPYIFELLGDLVTVKDIMNYIMPKPTANSFMLSSWGNMQEDTKKYALNQASQVYVKNGEKLKFYSNYYINNVGIHIEGEHIGDNDISVKKGTTLYDILDKVSFTPLSEIKNIRLYRKSVANIQKQLIETMLKDLESRAFTSDSSTVEEANIRNKESEMVLKFVERAKSIEPLGQIVLDKKDDLNQIYLEEGDKIVVPKWSNVVVVQGEVNIPNALTYKANYTIDKYIEICGGYSDRANRDKILLIKANGQVIKHSSEAFFSNHSPEKVEAGDSILVLGKVDSKNILITSSVTQIMYQLAVGAAVVLKAF